MTPEEQAAEDERAREAALRSIASMGDVGSQTASALTPATEPDAAFDADGVGPISIEPSSEPDPLAENTDLTSGVAGVDGIHDYDFEALPREEVVVPSTPALARDDMEPLGGVSRGQMVAPSGAAESTEGRFARLGVGGDFSGSGIAPVTADDALGRRAAVSPASAIPSTVETPDPAAMKPARDPAREASAGPLPTLDQGLPTQDEIGRAHTSDDWRRALHAIGSGLMVAGGRSPTEFHGQAEGLEQERRAGIQAALQRKGLMRGQEQTQAATSARQAVEDRLRERQAAQRDRGLDLQEQALPSRIAATEALTEQRGASTEHTRATTEDVRAEAVYRASSRADLESATSGSARAERAAIAARLEMYPADVAERERAAIAEQGDMGAMNATQLHRIREALTSGVGVRGMGRGGGGPSAPPAPGATLAEQYVAHGIAPDLESAQALIASLGGAEDTHAISRLDRRLDEETPPPPTGSVQANIAAAQGAADEIQDLIARSGRDIPGIGRLDALVPTIALSEEGRRMRALVLNLSDNYLRMVSGAAIPAHEIESFAERLGASDEPIFREQVARIQREIARRQTGSAASPATATHRRPRTQAEPTSTSPAEDFSQMSDEELRALAEGD